MLQRNYMSQTIAECIYDIGGTVCLSSVLIIIPNSPFAIVPQKSLAVPSSVGPWLPLASCVWCKEEQGQLTLQIQGSQTRLPPTCFVMGHPRKCFAEGVWEKSRAVLCLATQVVPSLGQGLLEAGILSRWDLCGRILWTGADPVGNSLSF